MQWRGKNKFKEVAALKDKQKIKVQFYNNRVLSRSFSRHLGRIVRDTNITPLRVKAWANISGAALEHIFETIKDKFENKDESIKIDMYKNEIMDHVKDLWINWRGDLNRHFVKPAKTMQEAIKNVPKDVDKSDWEWLVKEHFYSKEFRAKSIRNSKNRSNLKMPHRTGSKPYREIIWDMGGKDNKPPSMDKLFFHTHKKGEAMVDVETSSKHAQIENVVKSNPSLSNIEVMDMCYPSKRRDHVVGYGGGIKARDLRGPVVTKAELLSRLQESEENNKTLQEQNHKIMDQMSQVMQEWAEMKSCFFGRHDDGSDASPYESERDDTSK